MKKYFCKGIALCLLGVSSLTFTACDDSIDWATILTNLVTQFLGGKGETTTYNVAASIRTGVKFEDTENYGFREATTLQTNIQITLGRDGKTADVTIPGMQMGDGVQMSDVTLYNLDLVNGSNTSTLELRLGDKSSIDGKVVSTSGTEYVASNAYIEDVTITNGVLKMGVLDLYFGEELDYCVDVQDLKGTQVAQ